MARISTAKKVLKGVSNKVLPVPYKQILRSLEAYKKQSTQKNRQGRSKYYRSEVVESFERDIAQYLTKSGELRKNISQKRLKEFNRKVEEFKQSGHATTKERQATIKRDIEKKQASSMVSHGVASSVDVAEKAQDITRDKAIQYLIDKNYLSWYEVLDMAEDDITDEELDNFTRIADYIKNTMENDTPQEALDDLLSDDLYINMREASEIRTIEEFAQKYEEIHAIKLPNNDALALFEKFTKGNVLALWRK